MADDYPYYVVERKDPRWFRFWRQPTYRIVGILRPWEATHMFDEGWIPCPPLYTSRTDAEAVLRNKRYGNSAGEFD